MAWITSSSTKRTTCIRAINSTFLLRKGRIDPEFARRRREVLLHHLQRHHRCPVHPSAESSWGILAGITFFPTAVRRQATELAANWMAVPGHSAGST
jgi:hypothetical protein